MVEVLRGGGAYVLQDLRRPDKQIHRAADKVKPCPNEERYFLDDMVGEDLLEEDAQEPAALRLRKKTKRYITECE